MPDYAETEIMANELQTAISGCKVVGVIESGWHQKRSKSEKHDLKRLIDWKLLSITRVGKALLFAFEQPRCGNLYMSSRLGMSGRWLVYTLGYDWRAINGWALTLILQHDQGKVALVHTDARKFGTIEIGSYAHEIESLRIYGPEIRSSQFTKEWVEFCCARHRTPIKALLLEQRYFSGCSNWLASEVLFKANIHPLTASNQLSKEQVRRLFESIHLTINNAITLKGAQIYGSKNSDNSNCGGMNVYGRDGKGCNVCRDLVRKTQVHKRATYWCQKCQSQDWVQPRPVDADAVRDVVRAISLGGANADQDSSDYV